jgi:hypothetical protein
MRSLLVVALVACQRGAPEQAVGSGSAPAVLNTQVVGCAPAAELPHAVADGVIPTAWFPYATLGETPAESIGSLASKANQALVENLADLDLCLTDKTGSVSIMLEIAPTGKIKPRVGGIGHHPTELCIAKLVAKVALPPPSRVVELECGLSAGDAGPLRVDVEGGYRVVELAAEVTLDGKPAVLDQPLAGDAAKAVLVVAAPDTDGERLAKVVAWVKSAPAVLVAVRADGGPPVFLAMSRVSEDDKRVAVSITGEEVRACSGSHRGKASLLEAKRVDAMLADTIAACGEACPEIVEVGIGGKHAAKQLVGATSAVRRAGRDPVLVLGSRCLP